MEIADPAGKLGLLEALPPMDARKKELLVSRMTRDGQGISSDGFSSNGSASNSSIGHSRENDQNVAPNAVPDLPTQRRNRATPLKRSASEPANQNDNSPAAKRQCTGRQTPTQSRSQDGFQTTAQRAVRTNNTPRKPSPKQNGSIRNFLVAKPPPSQATSSSQPRALFPPVPTTPNAESDDHVNQLRQENTKIENQLKGLLSEMEQRTLSYEATAQQLKDRVAKSRHVTAELLVSTAKYERSQCRIQSDANCLRLGQFVVKRRVHDYVDTWVEGQGFRDVHTKLSQLKAKKETIEASRKVLVRQKPVTMTTAEDGLLDSTAVEYANKEEILKLRVAQVKKEETELIEQISRLERDRNLHVRELKRIRDEDASAYNNFAELNNRYLLLSLLGKGGFSEVYKGYDLEEMRYVACKIHQLSPQWSDEKKHNYTKHACREYNIHKSLEHPRIVKLLDVFEMSNDAFCTVLEYRPGCDLDFHLKQQSVLPEKEARSIICQVIAALRYLNELVPAVIHYDLKPANLLYSDGEVQITDFGLSKVMEEHSVCGAEMELTSQGAGTYWYLPPETFEVGDTKPKISSKVDVWSVGVILYQCLYGRRPFGHDLTQQGILQQRAILNAREVVFPARPAVSAEAKDFMQKCLTYSKDLRPDVTTLCQHPFVRK